MISLYLYVGGKRFKAGFEIGWFSGNEWKLLDISLFCKLDSIQSFRIFDVQILKFNIGFGFDWDGE